MIHTMNLDYSALQTAEHQTKLTWSYLPASSYKFLQASFLEDLSATQLTHIRLQCVRFDKHAPLPVGVAID